MDRKTSYASLIGALVAGALAPVACGGATQSPNEATAVADAGAVLDAVSTLDAGPDGVGHRDGFTPLSCEGGTTRLAALTAVPPIDYSELREEDGYRDKTSPDAVIDKLGTLCKTASDVAACTSKFQAIQRPVELTCGVPYPCTARYLATTRGDEVATYLAGRDDLGALAAPIETIDEAAMVVGWMGDLTCSNGSYRTTADGFDIAYTYSTDFCTTGKAESHDVLVHIRRDGVVTVLSDDVAPTPMDARAGLGCATARRAAGVVYAQPESLSDSGDWLAWAAHLEAASVASFARLARELAAHGAPMDLVTRARGAALQERRHAQRLRAAARSLGKVVRRAPRLARTDARSLESIALENAVEGAARETWGAVVVAHQAATASTAQLREAFRTIARDEAEHAELASDVARWLDARLPAAARDRITEARRAAIALLGRQITVPIPEAVGVPLGLPAPAVAARLFAGARAHLLAA